MPNVGFIRKEVRAALPKWQQVQDVLAGEIAIKQKGPVYLPIPKTSKDEAENLERYQAYKKRTEFYPATGRTHSGLVGQVFRKEIVFDIPSEYEFLKDNVDGSGGTLEQQAKIVLGNVVAYGRGGFLVDAPRIEPGAVVTVADVESGKVRPRILFYEHDQIINWRTEDIGGETNLSLVVLKEQAIINDDGFEFECEPRWRVLQIVEGVVVVSMFRLGKPENQESGSDAFELVDEPTFLTGPGGNPITEIPFQFIGSTNNDSTVDEAPLYDLSSMNISHYQLSADNKQVLYLSGQPTPVFSGLTEQWMTDHMTGTMTLGSANAIGLPVGASAQFLQVQAEDKISKEMKSNEERMKALGAKLIEPGQVEKTATEAGIEEAAESCVLSTIAKNVSAAYKSAFVFASMFMSPTRLDLNLFQIALNSEFETMALNAQERQEVREAYLSQIIAFEEVREVYRKKGIAFLDDDEARKKIETDLGISDAFGSSGDAGGGPSNSGDDGDDING